MMKTLPSLWLCLTERYFQRLLSSLVRPNSLRSYWQIGICLAVVGWAIIRVMLDPSFKVPHTTKLKVMAATVFGTFGLFAQAIYYLVITGTVVIEAPRSYPISYPWSQSINLSIVVHSISWRSTSSFIFLGLCSNAWKPKGSDIFSYKIKQEVIQRIQRINNCKNIRRFKRLSKQIRTRLRGLSHILYNRKKKYTYF